MKDIDIAFLPELLNLTWMPEGVEHTERIENPISKIN